MTMLFSKKKKEIEETQKRARGHIPEILPLLKNLPKEEVDDVEDALEAHIVHAHRKVKRLGGKENSNNNVEEKKEAS